MHAVYGPRDDVDMGMGGMDIVDQRSCLLFLVNRNNEDLGVLNACGMQKVRTRGIAVERLESELSEEIDLLGRIINHGC
jgi:hypothetical protein